MHDYVHWHCSYCDKLILVDENLCENCSYFTLILFLLKFLWGNVLLGGEVTKRCKKLKF